MARKIFNRKTIIICFAIIATASALIYAFSLTQEDKDNANTLATSIGIQKLIPWEERAITATKTTIINSKQNLASTIISLSHPSAENSRLADFSVTRAGEIIKVQFQFEFTGSLTGAKYTQYGEWKFAKNQDFGYIIISDNAPFSVTQEDLSKIQTYFQSEVYPVTLGNVR